MSYPIIILTSTLGTALEWAEYTFFAYMADQLSSLFFAPAHPEIARLKTYIIFATSYFVRPLGALLFGIIGDKKGRKPALIMSMFLMCIATTCIGCLPTYYTIGSTAAILLLICRLLQGFAVAGEFNGAAVFMIEHSQKKPFLAGSFAPFAAALGMGMGAFAATMVSSPTAPSWAWRIPFLCSGLIGLIAIYIRNSIQETPIFNATLSQHSHQKKRLSPMLLTLRKDTKAFFMTICMGLYISIYVYIGNIYYKTLCVKLGGFAPLQAAKIISFGQWLAAAMILFFGMLADRMDGKKLCLAGLFFAFFLGPIIILAPQTGNLQFAIMGQIIYAILNGMVSAPMMSLMIQSFRPDTRYTGNSFGWSLSAAIFGGTALIVAETLVMQLKIPSGPGLYISFAALLAFLSIGGFNALREYKWPHFWGSKKSIRILNGSI